VVQFSEEDKETTWDNDQARGSFEDLGIEMEPGTAPGTLAIPAEQNCGVIFGVLRVGVTMVAT
jgi:hypothetical protein